MLNTYQKIKIAQLLYFVIMSFRRLCFLPSSIIKKRRGIYWSLDLKEGIDLAIYLLGGFEIGTLRQYAKLIRPGDIVSDIGANVGAHTLPLANLVGDQGKVFAFEPTEYAFQKLIKNISLNPLLASRIMPQQIMLVDTESNDLPPSVYSSWPLHHSDELHKAHRGRLMSTQGAITTTLDDFIKKINLQKLHFIKLDVDGNEYEVLTGGKETLKKFKPTLIMELAPYSYESIDKFDRVLHLLWELGYKISNISNGKILPNDPLKIRKMIPSQGGINSLITAS